MTKLGRPPKLVLSHKQAAQVVAAMLATLEEKERLALSMSFGIGLVQPLDVGAIANRLGVRPHEAREILKTARAKFAKLKIHRFR